MRERSRVVTALSCGAMMVALYAQLGAISLILGGSIFTVLGSMQGAVTLLLGVLFLGLAVASYVVAFGLWTRKHWSWAGGIAIFGALIVASLLLTALSGTIIAAPVPIAGAAAGLWLLYRPAVKAALLGDAVVLESEGQATEGMGAVPASR